MSDTATRLRNYWIEALLAVFGVANTVAIILVPGGETVPFHFIWVSITLVYAVRNWSLLTTSVWLVIVTLGSGAALGWAVSHTNAGLDETAEVPLMAAMFVAMMWHKKRRQVAMTEARQAAERELRLVRERDIVRDTSHELRTPITVARGYAELIRTAYAGEQASKDAEVILDELNRLARISDRLLILAAAEHPDFLHRAPVELERLVVEAARRWSAAAERAWTVDATVEGRVLADEERLETSLDALIENAIKFTRAGDRITIGARADRNGAVIEVADTGVGIPASQLGRIFNRFARGDTGRGPGADAPGTGLGLAIVKAITEAHGGSVGVESEVGKGTTFSIRLPDFARAGEEFPSQVEPAVESPARTARLRSAAGVR